jgi:predicted phosphodiesterase
MTESSTRQTPAIRTDKYRDAVRRIAALYDVHANLPALEAVLAVAEGREVELIVFGGDLALGPIPSETLDRIIALGSGARCIRGNCDRLMVDAFDGNPLGRIPPAMQQNILWSAGQLDTRRRDFLANLPPTLSVNVEGLGDVLFCHATPRSDDEIITVTTPAGRTRDAVDGIAEKIVVCGHTHMQYDRRIGDVRIINAGSVGMPYGDRGAYWLLLGPDVELKRTDYDFAGAADSIRKTRYPEAETFASKNILNPPSKEEMLAIFNR